MTKHLSAWAIGFSLALEAATGTPAQPDRPLPVERVLDRAGRHMEKFWNYFAAVTCSETLTQSKIGPKAKVLFEQRQTFDYLITLEANGTELSVDESRIEKARQASKGKASLLETNGFAVLTLIFHPRYQSRYKFRRLPDETVDGRRRLRVDFQQVQHERALSALLLRGHEYPLEWSGTAWIDPASWAVVRMQAGVGSSLADTGVARLDADVTYEEIAFNGATRYWLPVRAVIEAETRRQHWRNVHLFSNYRRFDVETEIKVAAPQ